MNVEGIATELIVDGAEHFETRKYVGICNFCNQRYLSYKLSFNTDSVFIGSAALSMLLTVSVSDELILSSAYEVKLQQTEALQTILWDFDLTVVPLINLGHCRAGTFLN